MPPAALQGGIDDATASSGGGYFHLLQDSLEVAVPGDDLTGYGVFQTLVPDRDLLPPTYCDPCSSDPDEEVLVSLDDLVAVGGVVGTAQGLR